MLYILLFLTISATPKSDVNIACLRYLKQVIAESRYYGLWDAADIFMGQLEQESGCQNVTAKDGGMGIAQFMRHTAEWIQKELPEEFSEFKSPNPYNPKWAIRAMIVYDNYLLDRVNCPFDWYYALRAYNGGLGNINKEISKANSCKYEIVEKHCSRKEENCKINIEYPKKIFDKASKWFDYIY